MKRLLEEAEEFVRLFYAVVPVGLRFVLGVMFFLWLWYCILYAKGGVSCQPL